MKISGILFTCTVPKHHNSLKLLLAITPRLYTNLPPTMNFSPRAFQQAIESAPISAVFNLEIWFSFGFWGETLGGGGGGGGLGVCEGGKAVSERD